MTTFHYRGLNNEGSVIEGDVRADVRQDAYRAMEYRGLRPIRVDEYPDARSFSAERIVVSRTTMIIGVTD